MSAPPLAGVCPMGCGYSLVVIERGGALRAHCQSPSCPRPSAADDLLHDLETQHVVTVHTDGVTIRHPLRERLDNELDDCTLLYALTVTHPPPVGAGRWRVFQDATGRPFGWEQVPD